MAEQDLTAVKGNASEELIRTKIYPFLTNLAKLRDKRKGKGVVDWPAKGGARGKGVILERAKPAAIFRQGGLKPEEVNFWWPTGTLRAIKCRPCGRIVLAEKTAIGPGDFDRRSANARNLSIDAGGIGSTSVRYVCGGRKRSNALV